MPIRNKLGETHILKYIEKVNCNKEIIWKVCRINNCLIVHFNIDAKADEKFKSQRNYASAGLESRNGVMFLYPSSNRKKQGAQI